MGFGYSDPANEGAYMYESDVVIAGFKGTSCFAVDFYLSAYLPCGHDTTDQQAYGVCPDSIVRNNLICEHDRVLDQERHRHSGMAAAR